MESLPSGLISTEHYEILSAACETTLKPKTVRIIFVAHNVKQELLLSFDKRADLFGRFEPDYSLSFDGDLLWDRSPEVLDL